MLTDEGKSFDMEISGNENTISEEIEDSAKVETASPAEKKDEHISLMSIFGGCKHEEMGTIFSFQFENSTARSSYKPYCKNCNHYFGYTRFIGTPDDLSYLDVVKQYIEGQEVKPGEYHTMTATVYLGDYEVNKTRIRCEIEHENVIVGFSVEFREGFEEQISLLQKGDEITFRGRLYDNGFGWTDCELLEI